MPSKVSPSESHPVRETEHSIAWARAVRKDRPPADADAYLQELGAFFDHFAPQIEHWRRRNAGYHRHITSLMRFYVPPGVRVLEIGSGNGDLLAAVRPSFGLGIDISGEMIRIAGAKYPHLVFRQMSAERLDLHEEPFDYIILSDLIGYLYDIRRVLELVRHVCHARTRLVLNWYSRLWQPLITLAEQIGMKYPQPLLNWTTVEDVINLLNLSDFEVVHRRAHILIPLSVPFVSALANRFLAHLPGFRLFCFTNWIVARPLGLRQAKPDPMVSVICPCRNESGNIEQVVRRLPAMGAHTELMFVEGHSKDDTLQQCWQFAAAMPERDIKVLVQEGKGKADAVQLGFSKAAGDILMILDADLSVPPEDLPQFYTALVAGKGELINGSRLMYAMDPEAMRFLNLLGNKCFALLVSWLLGQPVKDTLCGTKAMWRTDYERIFLGRDYFGDFDPYGDYDLLFGASKLNLKIVDVPIRYRRRIYGATNISRFSDGWRLARMCWLAARRMVFI